MSARTQKQQILRHLRLFGSITARDAIRFGCYRLAARVHDLRADGHPIKSEQVKKGRASFARYTLTKTTEKAA